MNVRSAAGMESLLLKREKMADRICFMEWRLQVPLHG